MNQIEWLILPRSTLLSLWKCWRKWEEKPIHTTRRRTMEPFLGPDSDTTKHRQFSITPSPAAAVRRRENSPKASQTTTQLYRNDFWVWSYWSVSVPSQFATQSLLVYLAWPGVTRRDGSDILCIWLPHHDTVISCSRGKVSTYHHKIYSQPTCMYD